MWLGLQAVSSLERCPLFGVLFVERFRCTHVHISNTKASFEPQRVIRRFDVGVVWLDAVQGVGTKYPYMRTPQIYTPPPPQPAVIEYCTWLQCRSAACLRLQ